MDHRVFQVPAAWREPINVTIPCKSRLRKWAFENAPMLIVIAIAFFINLGMTIALTVWTWTHG